MVVYMFVFNIRHNTWLFECPSYARATLMHMCAIMRMCSNCALVTIHFNRGTFLLSLRVLNTFKKKYIPVITKIHLTLLWYAASYLRESFHENYTCLANTKPSRTDSTWLRHRDCMWVKVALLKGFAHAQYLTGCALCVLHWKVVECHGQPVHWH